MNERPKREYKDIIKVVIPKDEKGNEVQVTFVEIVDSSPVIRYLDVREFYHLGGQVLPTQRGATIPLGKMLEFLDAVEKVVREAKSYEVGE